MQEYNCPVCGYGSQEQLKDSQEICPSCGIQFGYDDAAGGSEELQQKIYSTWRKTWEENGKQKLTKEQIEAVHKEVNPS